LKYFSTLSLLTFLFIQSCNSQDTIAKIPATKFPIDKDRGDSLMTRIPQARGFINDFFKLFNDNEIQTLDSLVRSYEKVTTVEIVVATIDSNMAGAHEFEDYCLVMLNTWGVGKKTKNNGILIVISPDLRKIRVENGYGIEKALSNAETKEIVDNVFIPKFKEGKYFEGVRNGIIAITKKLNQNGKY